MSAILPSEPHTQTTVTRADVLRAETGENRVEVEDGEIISENTIGFLHVIVIQHLYDLLNPFVIAHQLGAVYIDGARYILAGTTRRIQ